MVFVFGMNLPIVEIMVLVVILFIVGLIFILWQIRQVDSHIKVLEQTTFEIKKYEEQEAAQVQRLDVDVKNFESEEAEMFVARVTPTIAKLENYVMAQLFWGKKPEQIVDMLVMKKIKKELAVKIVNQMSFYLDFYHKLPKKAHDEHHKAVAALSMAKPRGAPKMPEVQVKTK